MSGTATYELSQTLNAEAEAAQTVILRTRIHAANMTAHLCGDGQVRRYVHDVDTLTSLKRQLKDFDASAKRWRMKK